MVESALCYLSSQERGCKHATSGWGARCILSVDKTTTFLGSRLLFRPGGEEEQTADRPDVKRDGGEGGGVPPVVFGVAGEDYTTPDAEFAGGLDCD